MKQQAPLPTPPPPKKKQTTKKHKQKQKHTHQTINEETQNQKIWEKDEKEVKKYIPDNTFNN